VLDFILDPLQFTVTPRKRNVVFGSMKFGDRKNRDRKIGGD